MDISQSIDNILIPFFTTLNIISFKLIYIHLKKLKINTISLFVIILSSGGLYFNLTENSPSIRNNYSKTYINNVLMAIEGQKVRKCLAIYSFKDDLQGKDTTSMLKQYIHSKLIGDFTSSKINTFFSGQITFLKEAQEDKEFLKYYVEKNEIDFLFEEKNQTITGDKYELLYTDDLSGEKFYSTK